MKGNLPVYGAAASTEAIPFNHHFVPVDTVRFSTDVLLTFATRLEIDEAGRLLLSDRWGRQVALFDERGELIRVLDPEDCDPGLALDWTPLTAVFRSDGSILAFNNGPIHHAFDPDGVCTTSYPIMKTEGRVTAGPDTSIYLMNTHDRPDLVYLDHFDAGGERVNRIPLPPSDQPHLTYRFLTGGIVTDSRGNLYVGQVGTPYILHVDPEGTPQKYLGYVPSYFRPIRGDLGPPETQRPVDFERLIRQGSYLENLFMLDEDKLMITYRNRHNIGRRPDEVLGIVVIDTTGRALVSGEIQTERIFALHAQDGHFYEWKEPDVDSENPYLVAYRFVE